MPANHLGNLIAHGVHRVQACHWLLKDHGDLSTADRLHLFGIGLICQKVLPLEKNLSPKNSAWRGLYQLHDRHLCDGLAAARFAHYSNNLLFTNIIADIIDRFYLSGRREKGGA